MTQLRSRAVALAAVLATALVGAPVPAAQAAAPIKKGLYDCYGYSGVMLYVGTYVFRTPGRYGLAMDHKGSKLLGKVDWGRYRVHGKNILASSGPLKKNHFFLQKTNKRRELVLINDNGKATGIGCYWVAR